MAGSRKKEAEALSFSITVTNLTKQYRRGPLALDQVNLTIHSGMFGLLGPNGAGKTTFMRILATLTQPTTGEVRIGDINPASNPEAVRAMLGYLPQDFSTYRHLTVNQVLDYVALLKGLDDTVMRRREVARVLEQVHLQEQRRMRVAPFPAACDSVWA